MQRRRTRIWRDPGDRPMFRGGAVVAIGVFDGVHLGHRALLDAARSVADERHLPLAVVTFHPHPLSVVRPGSEPQQLATIRHRVELLSAAGADAVNLLEFTRELSQTEPGEWVRQTLVTMPARAVVVGEDFRFGHLAAGDTALLRRLGAQYDFDVLTAGLLADAGTGEPWSSSLIRASVAEGDMAAVRRGLGRNHVVEGLVVHGEHRGRDLGYPTANINPLAAGYGGPVAMPRDGVYAGWLVVNPHQPGTTHFPAAISVGTNPTFEERGERRVEAYVLDQNDLTLYDHLVAIEFADLLRDQITYDDAEPLKEQMARDVAQTRSVLETAQHN
jgi:riboflavin kinase/FMN adenylyltransferase